MPRRRLLIVLAMFAVMMGCEAPTKVGVMSREEALQAAFKHVQLGQSYGAQGRLAMAKQEFLIAAELDPTNTNIWGMAATAARDNMEFDEAVKYFNKIIALDPNDFRPYVGIGQIKKHMRQFDEAIAAFESAMQLNATDMTAPALLASIYYERKEYDKCERYMEMFETIVSHTDMRVLPEIEKIKINNTLRQFANYRQVMPPRSEGVGPSAEEEKPPI